MKYRVIWSNFCEHIIEADTEEQLFDKIHEMQNGAAEDIEVLDIYDNGRNIIFSREQ